ncbi:uncharacterized protein LOC136091541 [Hydra vulgaris]|uniref:Uncharacterized protein LOC136091541 n=1 Tax=Hydra vulgaris TaxID=6087 RepID=A0ABM4DL86_HYDVU
MARGIFSSLCYYFGHFASEGFKSDQIYSCAWNAIMILESIGLKVRAIVSDGATANRKFYNLHKMEDSSNISEGVVYWTLNHCAPERKIFFICDVPHLLKTTRNNLENSHWNKKSRNLMYKEQELGWHQIISLYEWDVGFLRDAPGLRMGHKLRDEHINLTPQSRMRVNLAVQVLSSTVVHMLEEQNDVKTVSLRKFISFMYKFFDCMNVSKFINKTRKDALNPYISAEDPRFKWLSKDFLGFLSEWEKESNSIPNLSKEEQSRLCLSKQTLEGLRISVHSFVELGKILLLEDGVKFLLSEKFTQDPVEEYFSKQRRRGGCNENPTLEEFNRNVLGLNVALIQVMSGNSRGRDREILKVDVLNETLPCKKRKK